MEIKVLIVMNYKQLSRMVCFISALTTPAKENCFIHIIILSVGVTLETSEANILTSLSLDFSLLFFSILQKHQQVKSVFIVEGKTEFISSSGNALPLTSLNGVNIKLVKDFKYLGSYINSSENDFITRSLNRNIKYNVLYQRQKFQNSLLCVPKVLMSLNNEKFSTTLDYFFS